MVKFEICPICGARRLYTRKDGSQICYNCKDKETNKKLKKLRYENEIYRLSAYSKSLPKNL